MAVLEYWTLWLHILTGSIAVVTGIFALASKKGGLWHRRAGKLFVGSLGIVVLSVFALLGFGISRLRVILSLVAILSGYFVFSGYRVVYRRRSGKDVNIVDWAGALFVALSSLILGVWGIIWFLSGEAFGVVMAVFGGIGVSFGLIDIQMIMSDGVGDWRVNHLQRMIAAFIATISAVSAVNLSTYMGVWAWLWPTLVGTPFIYYWSDKYSMDN